MKRAVILLVVLVLASVLVNAPALYADGDGELPDQVSCTTEQISSAPESQTGESEGFLDGLLSHLGVTELLEAVVDELTGDTTDPLTTPTPPRDDARQNVSEHLSSDDDPWIDVK